MITMRLIMVCLHEMLGLVKLFLDVEEEVVPQLELLVDGLHSRKAWLIRQESRWVGPKITKDVVDCNADW
ncbi:hypothetical protein U9M48_008779 [Paspalum notatum var. saurae]|uniref:Uncharacterized protein n=1 Tax=Paspalum notatum var. saurae TaxID=547442 RepID=A0AAQ3SPY3_PASNO